MLRYELLRFQWLAGALGSGLVLLLTAATAYLAIWRPRPALPPDPGRTPLRTFLLLVPAVLVLTFGGLTVFMLVYFAAKIDSPPNW